MGWGGGWGDEEDSLWRQRLSRHLDERSWRGTHMGWMLQGEQPLQMPSIQGISWGRAVLLWQKLKQERECVGGVQF